jgi:hypothetical protein
MALMIWYRNQGYDRGLSIFILFLGLIQLVEFAIHGGASGSESGKWIFMILWSQILALAIGVAVYTPVGWLKWIAIAIAVLAGVLFCVGIYYTVTSTFDAKVGPDGHIQWIRDGGSLMGPILGPLYVLGLFLPLIVLWIAYDFAAGPLVLILYGAVSAMFVATRYSPESFSSMWCYLAVGFAFLVWMLGMFKCC